MNLDLVEETLNRTRRCFLLMLTKLLLNLDMILSITIEGLTVDEIRRVRRKCESEEEWRFDVDVFGT